jgi:hypothetical protein
MQRVGEQPSRTGGSDAGVVLLEAHRLDTIAFVLQPAPQTSSTCEEAIAACPKV